MHKQVACDCMCEDIKRKSIFFVGSVRDYNDLIQKYFDHSFWHVGKKENRPVGQRTWNTSNLLAKILEQ